MFVLSQRSIALVRPAVGLWAIARTNTTQTSPVPRCVCVCCLAWHSGVAEYFYRSSSYEHAHNSCTNCMRLFLLGAFFLRGARALQHNRSPLINHSKDAAPPVVALVGDRPPSPSSTSTTPCTRTRTYRAQMPQLRRAARGRISPTTTTPDDVIANICAEHARVWGVKQHIHTHTHPTLTSSPPYQLNSRTLARRFILTPFANVTHTHSFNHVHVHRFVLHMSTCLYDKYKKIYNTPNTICRRFLSYLCRPSVCVYVCREASSSL